MQLCMTEKAGDPLNGKVGMRRALSGLYREMWLLLVDSLSVRAAFFLKPDTTPPSRGHTGSIVALARLVPLILV